LDLRSDVAHVHVSRLQAQAGKLNPSVTAVMVGTNLPVPDAAGDAGAYFFGVFFWCFLVFFWGAFGLFFHPVVPAP